MMLAETEEDFNQKLAEFYSIEKKQDNIDYLQNNWLNCIDKWAKYKRCGLPMNCQETNNPVEVPNGKIKDFSTSKHAQATIAQCISILGFFSFVFFSFDCYYYN